MRGPTVNCRPSGPPPRSGGRAGIRGYAGPHPAPGRPARRARLSLRSPRGGGWCWRSSTWPRRPRCCCSACMGPWAATYWTSLRPPAWRWWSAWASWSPRPPASSSRCLRYALLRAPSARAPEAPVLPLPVAPPTRLRLGSALRMALIGGGTPGTQRRGSGPPSQFPWAHEQRKPPNLCSWGSGESRALSSPRPEPAARGLHGEGGLAWPVGCASRLEKCLGAHLPWAGPGPSPAASTVCFRAARPPRGCAMSCSQPRPTLAAHSWPRCCSSRTG